MSVQLFGGASVVDKVGVAIVFFSKVSMRISPWKGPNDEPGVETYRSMRVQGYLGGSDVPEYEDHCKQVVKKQKKQVPYNLKPWVASG